MEWYEYIIGAAMWLVGLLILGKLVDNAKDSMYNDSWKNRDNDKEDT